ncbi:hypothetical protein ACE193_19725 [Bernardetia sp. OM2101]|uniref:hypothetical protein n=1 Tax=Bernardetia sp. OM2101 TaxID=3344876 RepID=UPI0035CF8FC9
MHIHKISNQKHIHFLKEERKDPITGDLIVEGNEVVFCAECKSAFFKSSWEYIGKQHCESDKTLSKFPRNKDFALKYRANRNNLYFILAGSASKKKKFLQRNLDNLWQGESTFIRLPESIGFITKTRKVLNLEKNSILLTTVTLLVLLIFFALITIGSFSKNEEGVIFLVVLVVLFIRFLLSVIYPLLKPKQNKIGNQLKEQPFLFFDKSSLSIYFDSEKVNYFTDYKNISKISFRYLSRYSDDLDDITITTKNGNSIKLKKEKYDSDEVDILKKAIKTIHSNSPTTVINFIVTQDNHSIKNSLESDIGSSANVWIN